MGIQWVEGLVIMAFGVYINRHNGHGAAALFHRKIEEGGGVGLVFQREVPPLAVVGLEAMAYHQFAQHQAVLLVLWGDLAPGVFACKSGVGWRFEIIEVAAHVHLFLGVLIADGHVDRAALGVPRFRGDILGEEALLGKVGIVVFLVALVIGLRPSHEVVDGSLRAVGIINFHHIAFLAQLIGSLAQCRGRFFRENGMVGLVAIGPFSHEVVGGEIAQVLDQVGDEALDIDEAFMGLALWLHLQRIGHTLQGVFHLLRHLLDLGSRRVDMVGNRALHRYLRGGNSGIVDFGVILRPALGEHAGCQQNEQYGNGLSFHFTLIAVYLWNLKWSKPWP